MLADATLELAKKQLGVVEKPKGSNAGPEVEIYLKSVGLPKGYSWCMAFVYWCTQETSVKLGLKNPLYKTAGCLKQWQNSTHLWLQEPKVGSVFVMDFGKGKGHTGFVEAILPNGYIQTIEGNTNDDGSREGYKVCRHTRKISSIYGYLKL